MHCSGLKGEGALMGIGPLALGPVNVTRARHDLRTLAGHGHRGARIRTGDLRHPKAARYQAAPRPEALSVER